MQRDQNFKLLKIRARQQVYTLLSGNNLSRLNGEGYDLSELREYHPGDDVRKINWIITAKQGKPYIKELHANRELSIVTAALAGGSLWFGEGNAKQLRMAETTALLGYAAHHNGDLFTGALYREEGKHFTIPTKQRYSIENFARVLYESDLSGSHIDDNASIKDLFTRVQNRSLIFVMGDFLQNIDLSLLAQKHEVIALIIRDRREEQPEKLGEVILKNPETGGVMNTFFGPKSIRRYLTEIRRNDERLIAHFSRYNIRYTKIFSDEEPITKLTGLFR